MNSKNIIRISQRMQLEEVDDIFIDNIEDLKVQSIPQMTPKLLSKGVSLKELSARNGSEFKSLLIIPDAESTKPTLKHVAISPSNKYLLDKSVNKSKIEAVIKSPHLLRRPHLRNFLTDNSVLVSTFEDYSLVDDVSALILKDIPKNSNSIEHGTFKV